MSTSITKLFPILGSPTFWFVSYSCAIFFPSLSYKFVYCLCKKCLKKVLVIVIYIERERHRYNTFFLFFVSSIFFLFPFNIKDREHSVAAYLHYSRLSLTYSLAYWIKIHTIYH